MHLITVLTTLTTLLTLSTAFEIQGYLGRDCHGMQIFSRVYDIDVNSPCVALSRYVDSSSLMFSRLNTNVRIHLFPDSDCKKEYTFIGGSGDFCTNNEDIGGTVKGFRVELLEDNCYPGDECG